MYAGILITNGGPHPAEKWAIYVAERIVPTDNVTIGDRPMQALALQVAVAKAISDDFEKAQSEEKSRLFNDSNHLNNDYDVDLYVEPMMQDIVSCAKGTPWEAHYNSADVQNEIRSMLRSHVWDTLHIERMYHADANPDMAPAREYKARFNAA